MSTKFLLIYNPFCLVVAKNETCFISSPSIEIDLHLNIRIGLSNYISLIFLKKLIHLEIVYVFRAVVYKNGLELFLVFNLPLNKRLSSFFKR